MSKTQTYTHASPWHGDAEAVYTVTEGITIRTAAGQTLQVGGDGFVRGPDKARSKLFRVDRWGVIKLLSKWQGCEVELCYDDLIEIWSLFHEGPGVLPPLSVSSLLGACRSLQEFARREDPIMLHVSVELEEWAKDVVGRMAMAGVTESRPYFRPSGLSIVVDPTAQPDKWYLTMDH